MKSSDSVHTSQHKYSINTQTVYMATIPTDFMRFLFHTKYYSGDKIKKNKRGEAFGMYEGEERYIQSFGGET